LGLRQFVHKLREYSILLGRNGVIPALCATMLEAGVRPERPSMNAPNKAKCAATRTETDSFGPIDVPADRYWGAQTQRSLQNFKIGGERMPKPIVRGLGLVKMAAAHVNKDMKLIDGKLADAISAAAQEVI